MTARCHLDDKPFLLCGDASVLVFSAAAAPEHRMARPTRTTRTCPLNLMGQRWIRRGHNDQYTETVDIAPTLAALLRIRPPAGSEGKVLSGILHAK